jgi:hypothetical protein
MALTEFLLVHVAKIVSQFLQGSVVHEYSSPQHCPAYGK